MLAPVIGNPASISQKMVCRYSSSATVAGASDAKKSLHISRAACPVDTSWSGSAHQRGDHCLVEAVTVTAFGHSDVVETGHDPPYFGVLLRTIGDHEESPDRGR